MMDDYTFAGPLRILHIIRDVGDGVYYRETRAPGSDISDLSDEVRAEAASEWTDDVLAAYEAAADMPAPKRKVLKSVIISRLTDEQLTAIRGMLTVRQEERWRSPDYPVVNADDPDTIAVLRAAGADPDVILAP